MGQNLTGTSRWVGGALSRSILTEALLHSIFLYIECHFCIACLNFFNIFISSVTFIIEQQICELTDKRLIF